MKHTMKTLLGVLLALTMAVGLLPGMLFTAHADQYCPHCGSEDFGWNLETEEYDCPSCGNSFDTPSDTPLSTNMHGIMLVIKTQSRPDAVRMMNARMDMIMMGSS